MRHIGWLALGGLTLLTAGASNAGEKKDPPREAVVLGGLKSTPPADWKPEKPANRLRSHQFRLPPAKGDKDGAELTILGAISEPIEKSISRWKDLFEPPAGKSIDEVSKVEKFLVGKVKVTYLDVHGTYLQLSRPLASKKTGKSLPGYRMVSVFFETPESAHLIRLVGPAATVEQHKKGFDAWLKAFK